MSRLGLVLDHTPAALLTVMLLAAFVAPVVSTPEISWAALPTEQEQAQTNASVVQAELLQAQAVTVASAGLTCWDPSTGRVGRVIVVEWTDTQVVEVVPFTDAAYGQAQAGEFVTLRACT